MFEERVGRILGLAEAAIASSWLLEIGLLLAATLLAWPIARILARRLRRPGEPGESRELVVARRIVAATVWPILAMGLTAAALELAPRLWPSAVLGGRRVLPVLVFLLGFRILDQLLVEFVAGSTTRRRVRRGLMPLIFVLIALQQLHLLEPILEAMQKPLIGSGASPLTAFSILTAFAVLFGVTLLARALFSVVGHRFLPRFGVDRALAEAVATVVRYVVVTVGFLWALEILGFDLTTLKIAFGALGVGIGFGLQNIVNNFTSGLILLFERSVKRGDVLTVEGTDGKVEQVGLRASIIRTREGDDLIMPNSLLVENVVTNYSFRDRNKRVDVAVGVSYRSDPRQIEEILLRAANSCDRVLSRPEPLVLFKDFGESSIDFELRVWIDEAWDHPRVRSMLLFDIWYALAEAGVEIPFPQRDLHVRSGELHVRRVDGAPGGEV